MSGSSGEVPITEDERALAEIAAERYQRYEDVFRPLEEEFIGDVLDMRDDPALEQIAASDLAASFGEARERATLAPAQAAGYGSGRMLMSVDAANQAEAETTGMGLYQARQASDDRYARALNSLVQMGNGQAVNAISGMSMLADESSRRAIADAEAAQFARAATMKGIGTVAGAATRYYMPDPSSANALNSAQPAPAITAPDPWEFQD